MTNGGLHNHGYVIGERTNDIVAIHTLLEATEEDVGDQYKEEWGKRTTLSNSAGHWEARGSGASDLQDATAVMIEGLDQLSKGGRNS